MLEDVLAGGLRLVICGTAAGRRSAEVGHYYAGRGNKFWTTLAEIGLTPRLLAPSEHRLLVTFGIGLTDLAKGVSGMDCTLSSSSFDPVSLHNILERVQPAYLCFNGKRAAQAFLGRSEVSFGLQKETILKTRIFVAPSTSGAANGYWDLSIWQDLACLVSC